MPARFRRAGSGCLHARRGQHHNKPPCRHVRPFDGRSAVRPGQADAGGGGRIFHLERRVRARRCAAVGRRAARIGRPIEAKAPEGAFFMAARARSPKHQNIQQDDVRREQRERGGKLHLDHAVLVGQFEQRGGHHVEVRGHRRHQRAAVAGEHPDRDHHGRIAMEHVDEDRHADAARHHGERGEAVAHHHREERHADAVHGDRDEPVVEVHVRGGHVGDRLADARVREHQPEHAEHLRQHGRPRQRVDQPPRLLQRLADRIARDPAREPEGDHAADAETDQRDVLRIDERRAADVQMAGREGDRDRHERDRERRHEQPVADARGARAARIVGRQLRSRRRHAAETRDQRHHDHERADELDGQLVADEEDERVQQPEAARGEAARVRAVRDDRRAHREQHEADEPEQVTDRERHARPPLSAAAFAPFEAACGAALARSSRSSRRSSSHSRAPWITNADTAVGMPHSATRIGSTAMPASFRNVTISTIAPNATKISSPKKRPTLSVAAAYARSRWRIASGSGPKRFSVAPSAIGAISGRTICGWPPRPVRPTAAVSSRTSR
ncbi:hypothetical protein BURPS1710b_0445 [Burkholderia pseudomallei 1710b]|uniref:Uncharacterized protein n=1 Tax=Burkholderia pseudomallei (strain 1710b) TaxID=320372 RepID=Q3JX45_BURP1|nr:hypothetical protein BURPS1710b_0445 [Burkholderia pseudomallei 1710b]